MPAWLFGHYVGIYPDPIHIFLEVTPLHIEASQFQFQVLQVSQSLLPLYQGMWESVGPSCPLCSPREARTVAPDSSVLHQCSITASASCWM